MNWARALVGKTVIHVPSRIVGVVSKFYDGEVEKHSPPPDVVASGALPVTLGPVVELASGHSFGVGGEGAEGNFVVLQDNDVQCRTIMAEVLKRTVTELAHYAHVNKMEKAMFALVLGALLQDQARALR